MRRIILIATLIMTTCTCFGAGGHKVAIVMPFDIKNGGDSNYFDFYCGAFMAADSLCRQGMEITLKVIDSSDYAPTDTIDGQLFEDVDLIIGPVTPEQQKLFQNISETKQIPIVSPLAANSEIFSQSNPFFFEVPSSRKTQIENLVTSVIADGDGDIVLFYNKDKASDLEYLNEIEDVLKKTGAKYSKRSYGILQGRVITETLQKEMGNGKKKKIIIASEDEAFASDVVRNMALLENNGTELSIFGSNKLRNFETIDASLLYSLDYHFSTSYFVNYKDGATRSFVLNYRSLYETEPTPYAFQGYDILFYFVTLLNELGDSFMDFVTYYPQSLLQNNFRFDRINEDSGLVNKSTRDVRYLPDHSVVISTSLF